MLIGMVRWVMTVMQMVMTLILMVVMTCTAACDDGPLICMRRRLREERQGKETDGEERG